MPKKETKATDLKFDDKNFNKGTEYGNDLIKKSIEKFGAGRSILIDKNNRIIAGNKTTEQFIGSGKEKVLIIESDPDTLIAVKRSDIDLDSEEGRELALADNVTARTNIDFDFDVIDTELDRNTIEEWGIESNQYNPEEFGEGFDLPSGEKSPFQQITFTLADEQATIIKNAIDDVKKMEEYKYCETFGNENSNGNALYLIISQWGEQRI